MTQEAKKSKLSWPKTIFRKWLNIKGKSEEFQADDDVLHRGLKVNKEAICWGKCDFDSPNVHNYRIFAATWNVAGKSPPSCLNLEDWLHSCPPAEIYVLGFQEIVPLNAGNVLGSEDNGPAQKWHALIRKTLNAVSGSAIGTRTPSPVPDPVAESNSDFESSNSLISRRSFYSPATHLDRRFSLSEDVLSMKEYHDNFRWSSLDDQASDKETGDSRYCLVASKQMVGILLTVWVKRELKEYVRSLKVSCVGRGLMGYLGNKGSISISLSLHHTSFCFVCSHLTSGQKDGDEIRRNSDVMEILKKTRFPRVNGRDLTSPQTIMEHDRVIWVGDLNYRIALSYRTVKALVEMKNWSALLNNDQLQIEQKHGRVFAGWNEGKIIFPPTYKYSNNSDRYAGEDQQAKEKRRTPAWCDRILWYGKGLTQESYVRCESRFSDHRAVCSVFLAEVEAANRHRFKKSTSSRSRIEVEELLPLSHSGLSSYC